MMGPPLRRFAWSILFLLCPGALAASSTSINLYRYVLRNDVPESAGLIALGRPPLRVVRGSAPKPVVLSYDQEIGGSSSSSRALALDLVPYFLAGGGVRDLAHYRANSLGGRLARVLTKTSVSLAVVPDPVLPNSSRVAVAIRSTLHDPHDPVLNSRLPERVAASLGHRPPRGERQPSDGGISDRGVDLSSILAAAGREMRERRGVQLSGGFGLTSRLRGDFLSADSIFATREIVWVAGQITTGPRFDLLTTLDWRGAARAKPALALGAALLRKMEGVDVETGLSFDTRTRHAYPGLSAELRAVPQLNVLASFGTQRDATEATRRTEIFARAGVRWFTALDR